jgi:glutamate synthase (ferredoxin)
MRPSELPPLGLYRPEHERDACGVGFVADIHGRPTHNLIRQALTAVVNLTHRGAVSADGKSGDGAGVLTQIPRAVIRRELERQRVRGLNDADLAVGMFFLPDQQPARDRCIALAEEVVGRGGIELLGWREVPVDRSALGEKALATCPIIVQAIMRRPEMLSHVDFERRLYLTRRRIERAVESAGIERFYIPSFSHRTVVYKGLMVSPQLDRFYADLADPLFETAIAVFHQRYSTNTFPTWPLAQPFRFLGHNGEINTLQGNVNWMAAREKQMSSWVWGENIGELLPVIQPGGSDSACLDNVFELLAQSGRDPLHAMAMLVPEAYQNMPHMDEELRPFYEYHATLLEPWDGPAALAFSDGLYAAAALDRNGLRPARYWVTRDGIVIMGSEAGLVPVAQSEIVEKGRLGPGDMLAVDTRSQRLLTNQDIKGSLANRQPYREWVAMHLVRPAGPEPESSWASQLRWQGDLVRTQKVFGYGKEDLDRILEPMFLQGKEPVGSMGDDTPISALSEKPRLLYTYFKQRFAQVTNPPIDPLRERLVMSLRTAVGCRSQLLEERPEAARLIKFDSPILTDADFVWLSTQATGEFRSQRIECVFPVAEGPEWLERSLRLICDAAENAVDDGCSILILSDHGVGPDYAPIPMLLAVGAVHHHLIRSGKRLSASIICDTGEPREDHHFACLVGYGASLIYPYLAYASVAALAAEQESEAGISVDQALANYKAAVDKGLLKIMSKMGISTVSGYRGAQIFEALGIGAHLVDLAFAGTESRIDGLETCDLGVDVLRFHAEAYGEEPSLRERGIYRYRKGGEYHSFNPDVFKSLHRAVRTQSREAFQEYASLVESRPPCCLRDLLEWVRAPEPLRVEEVEPAEEIARRFCTQAMSHGALSREAHETLAIAMNRLGGKSNSGEGGEDPVRFYRYESDTTGDPLLAPFISGNGKEDPYFPRAGDWGNSAIKQVASGRFGVTPEYLVAARELEIKMAQGSKPGEGGQIPGLKVSEEIARIRHSVPGVTLISPPPHHDIYSIEDLAQLIYDLKRVNPRAKICVKLVSEVGVGTVAAGVAKGYADCIQISGHDGGTGASPISSIKNAGLPWELGLAETQQVLVMNDLRGRITLRADGGMKTGRDVVMAALLGAEEFGFGTAAVVSAGCIMARQCHMNNCPVGVATQDPALRAKFPGQPEHVVAFMLYIAEQIRQILAEMGFTRLEEIVGRTDLLRPRREVQWPKTAGLDLSLLLADPDPLGQKLRRCAQARNDRPETGSSLDERVWMECQEAVADGTRVAREYEIRNTDRTIGARLSGEIARRTRSDGLPQDSVQLHFRGSAGQSFGAFCNGGMMLFLEGEAQDYVGKSMAGGEIVIVPPAETRFPSHQNAIMGNTVLYGATGGSLYAAGRAGERLAVRNSGARCVVEGVGDHGCEYMTGGVVVVLGETGRNFGAGMSGGVAYVYDETGDFPQRYNPGMVHTEPVYQGSMDEHLLRAMIERHRERTGSPRAAAILQNWAADLARFRRVVPHPAVEEKTAREQDVHTVQTAAMEALRREGHAQVAVVAH